MSADADTGADVAPAPMSTDAVRQIDELRALRAVLLAELRARGSRSAWSAGERLLRDVQVAIDDLLGHRRAESLARVAGAVRDLARRAAEGTAAQATATAMDEAALVGVLGDHLRLTASRFLSGRATAGDVDEAARMWMSARPGIITASPSSGEDDAG